MLAHATGAGSRRAPAKRWRSLRRRARDPGSATPAASRPTAAGTLSLRPGLREEEAIKGRSSGFSGSTRSPPSSSRTVSGSQHCSALLSPLQSSQSRQLGRQPRAQRPEVCTRGAPRRPLRECTVPAAGRASVRVSLRLRPQASAPFPHPRPHHRILYPSVSRSPATMAPSMATPSEDPVRAPPSAWDWLRPSHFPTLLNLPFPTCTLVFYVLYHFPSCS